MLEKALANFICVDIGSRKRPGDQPRISLETKSSGHVYKDEYSSPATEECGEGIWHVGT